MFCRLTPLVDDSGQLEAQALAKGRGGLHIDVVAFEGGLDDLTLVGSCSRSVPAGETAGAANHVPKIVLLELTAEGEANVCA